MSLSVKGTISRITPEKTFSPNFKKQSIHFTMENGKFNTTIEVDFTNDKIGLLAGYMPGEQVELQLNLRGNAAKNDPSKIYNSISCWKIERIQSLTNASQTADRKAAQVDDLAF